MKRNWLFFLFGWLAALEPLAAQNLVVNGDFERYRTCPTQNNLLEEAVPWYNPNQATPDFLHACFPEAPLELRPHSGQGLVRLFIDLNFSEYAATSLTQPLRAGECYYLEMFVALRSPIKFLPGTFGAHVSREPLTSPNKGLLDAQPQVLDNQLNNATKPFEWQVIKGYIRPKGGERYLTIGTFGELPQQLGDYYVFLDDVSLRPIRVDLGRDTTLCGRSTLLLNAQTPGATDYEWSDGSTAPTLLVSKPGRYWVRAKTPCATVTDTITVRYTLNFALGRDTTLCDGQTLQLAGPDGATRYRWQDGSGGKTFLVRAPGSYGLTATLGGCTSTDSLRVRYIRPPRLDLGPDRELCFGESVTLRPVFAEGTFSWESPDLPPLRTVRKPGVYRATVRNDCATLTDSVTVQTGLCGCTLTAPDVFTPNADGHNETFQPVVLCPDLALTGLTVFNRWGEKLYETTTPPFAWDGTFRGEPCSPDTYVWRATYEVSQAGKRRQEQKQGALRLVR